MSGELYIIVCAVLGSLLFPLGGTDIPFFGRGFKWIRRELLPIAWATLAFTAGLEWWRCVGLAIGLDVAFRLPYGERTKYWLKAVVFSAYSLPTLFLGFNIWQLTSPAYFLLFVLSNWKPTERMFNWVTACAIIGGMLGVTIGNLIANTYR
jgi:hypothetical protein